MRNLVDSVLDDFDKNYDLPNLNEPSGYVFTHLFASPSTWGYVQRENNYRIAEIEIEARVQVDVTTIT